MSDLFGNHIVSFSHEAALMFILGDEAYIPFLVDDVRLGIVEESP